MTSAKKLFMDIGYREETASKTSRSYTKKIGPAKDTIVVDIGYPGGFAAAYRVIGGKRSYNGMTGAELRAAVRAMEEMEARK